MTVLLPAMPSLPMKSKAKLAVVPIREAVSRLNWRVVALTGAGPAHKKAANAAARTEERLKFAIFLLQ